MMTSIELNRTPLYDWHVAHGGRMVDFAGWSMPIQYTSIAEEHRATREAVGVFDISHMGRLQVRGAAPAEFLDALLTRRVTDMKPGQVRYSLVCNDDGGILDDVLVYRLLSGEGNSESPSYDVVVNASNRAKIIDWFSDRGNGEAAQVVDVTTSTAMIAVQGPQALELVASHVDRDLRAMRYYTSASASFDDRSVAISRTGYTGEDGCEIICDARDASSIWETILAQAAERSGMAVGLGARDTLRLEAAMPLYGHELSESTNPYQAGLSFAVNLAGREFVGRAALERLANDAEQPVRVGLQIDGKRVAREGCPVLRDEEVVGRVTSGTFSPTLERPIAMAYVRPTAQALGTRLAVDLRGVQHAAVVVPLPFYDRAKKD